MPAPSQTQSRLRHPLTALRGRAGHVRIWRAPATHGMTQSVPPLAAAAGLTPQGTPDVPVVLARQRLVKAHASGRMRLCELTAAHPLVSSLAALFQDSQGRRDALMGRSVICPVAMAP